MKKFVSLFFGLIFVLMTMQCACAARVYDCRSVPESRSIFIDGYSQESDWEDSLLIKAEMPDGTGAVDKYAVIRILCDRSFLYIQLYVIDDDRADFYGQTDCVLLEITRQGSSDSLRFGYDGAENSINGFEYVSVNSDCYYMTEARIPLLKQLRSNERFSLNFKIIDNFIQNGCVQKLATEKDIQLRIAFNEPSTTGATTTKVTAATEPTTAKPPKTTASGKVKTTAVKTTKPNDKTTAAVETKAERQTSYSFNSSADVETTALPQSTAEVCTGEQTDDLQQEQTLQMAQTYVIQGEDIQTSRFFGALGAGVLLFIGVFIIVLLRRGKNNVD